ncbi:MAG: hypothetical protein Q9160_007298 [Pyrenula sp. 1 TL-2023]
MVSQSFLSSLADTLSPSSRVLVDKESPEFAASMKRWSNYGLRIPFGIIQPANEQDAVASVQALIKNSIPFVPASGGHSPWSSIDQDGVILDLSRYKGVDVDLSKNLATIKGGTLMKEFQTALHPHKRFAAVGNGNTVGVIPYYIGGGISTYTPLVGYGSENITSAKIVTAKGDLVEVSESQHPDLFWGLRGAGQFLGFVVELTVKIYPYSLLGNDEGVRMCGTYIFLAQQVDAVCAALQPIMESEKYISAGHFMIVQAPPDFKQQALLVAPQVFCSADEAKALFQPLVDIGPIQQMLNPSTFDVHSDHLDYLCAEGDFKRFTQMGMGSWSTANFKKLIELHTELIEKCPDAAMSGYSVEWHTSCRAKRELDTSFGLENIDYWLNVFSWYKDAANHALVDSMDKKAQFAMRVGTGEANFVSYTNTSRDDPVAYRYKGVDRIKRLQDLKKQWDPTAVFTKELL